MKAVRIASSFITRFWNNSSDSDAILAAADAARDRSDWATAARDYQRYLKRRDNDAQIWVQLGNMYKEDKQIEFSMAAYSRAIALGLNTSDTHLQLGHLHKVMGDWQGAIDCYLRALEYLPLNIDAFEELERMGLADKADAIFRQRQGASLRNEHLLILDISDLVFYIGHHDNLSGIQRVQCCVIQAIIKYGLYDLRDLRFISYDRKLRAFRSVCLDRFLALLDDLALPKESRTVKFDAADARHGELFPEEPLVTFLRPGKTTLVLLGAAWVIPEYASLIVNLKRSHGARFAMLFHDFIPIYARETCDQGTAVVFKEFVDQMLPLVDLGMCVSRNTERDLKRYCGESGFPVPRTMVTRLGTSFAEFFPPVETAAPPRAGARDSFVLFVSTIEGRKNHNFMFKTWRALVKRGIEVPQLVCVGRIGWRAEAFLGNLLETDYLGGRIELREDVSDEALSALYHDCLFTVFPSVYEGWGLPIGESLGHRKLCVLANNSSLPEVAGEFGCFIPIDDEEAAADTIAVLLGDTRRLQAYEAAISARFAPLRWEDVAQTVVEGCLSLECIDAPVFKHPLITHGAEYTLKKLQGEFDGLLGSSLLKAMEQSVGAPITGGTAKTPNRLAGLLARDSNWFPAERWGSWARNMHAGLQFAIDSAAFAGESEVVFYGAFTSIGPMQNTFLALRVGGIPMGDERLFNSENVILTWQIPLDELHRRGRHLADGTIALDMGFELTGVTPAALEASRAIDPRGLTFGLKSFVLMGASAIPERLHIAERNGYIVR